MNPENKILPDDPRLTTYALGEMEAAEQSEFEQLLQQDADARTAVEAIRSTALTLGSALEGEPHPLADASLSHAAILPGGDPRKLDGGPGTSPIRRLAKVIRFPQLYFVVSTAAAACFAAFFIYWSNEQTAREAMKAQYVQVDLASAEALKKAQANRMAERSAAAKESVESRAMAKVAAAPAPAPTVTFAVPVAADEAVAPKDDAKNEVGRLDEADKPIALSPFEVSAAPAANSIAGASVGSTAAPAPAPQTYTWSSDSGSLANVQQAGSTSGAKYKGIAAAGGNARFYGAMRMEPKSFADAPSPVGDVRLRQKLGKDQEFNTEAYSQLVENPFLAVAQNPLSTFSIDVDTAAYANLRRFLTSGQRPPRDAVRIEELVNYFPYHYAGPADQTPFAASMEVAGAPWTPEHRLVRIGLKGREISDAARPKANLVFLLDVSGSMDEPNKLPLVKQSLHLLVNKLRPDDRVAIVVYAGASGMALPSTPARDQKKILEAIDQLQPDGSTNGAAGIQLAYDIAKANFITGGVNRVILATDGDFNVGTTSEGELTSLIEEKAKSGVFLTVLGFGMGNYKDSTLEKLADKGNGNYAYIDNATEARKALVEQAGGTLVTIAKDVKIQVEFNPAKVQAYRLIGYENRVLRNEDFNNDKVDAGEIGAGHTVTALYELVPAGSPMPETGSVDTLKYQKVDARQNATYAASSELLTLKVRYKEPTGDVSKKLEFPLRDSDHNFEQASADFKFAASVAAFGMILRDSPHKGEATFADVTNWAQSGIEDDAGGYRSEFIGLVHAAEAVVR
ncbi:MAG TPA: VWA domain-containing protein [Candidatus Didemnitutus sp.]|nr:VWA domain-containing protein [Candidatus Didemnitutus sp.]